MGWFYFVFVESYSFITEGRKVAFSKGDGLHCIVVNRLNNGPERWWLPNPQRLLNMFPSLVRGILVMWLSSESWDGKIILDSLQGVEGRQCSHNSPFKWETERSHQRGDMMTKSEFQVMSTGTTSQRFKMSLEPGKGKETDFPRASWRKAALPWL